MTTLLHFVCLSLAVSVIQSAEYLTEKPSYLKSCEIKKPEFVKCSTNSIQILFKKLADGIPGLTTIESFEPFALKNIKINQGNNNAVNIKVELSNIIIHGVPNTIVKESYVNPKDYSWVTKMLMPLIKMDADYAMLGRILIIPLNGHGKIYLELKNLNAIAYTKTKLYRKGNLIFYNITDIKIDYDINGLHVNLSNLFNGNRLLEDNANNFFNANWQVVADTLKPVVTQAITDVMLETLRAIFDYVPAEYFVSDIDSPEELYGTKEIKEGDKSEA